MALLEEQVSDGVVHMRMYNAKHVQTLYTVWIMV